jgi:DNA-directed RNA polymerase subunit K/omega
MTTKPKNTIPIISKYELISVLAKRTCEIANGEPITIPNPGTTDPKKIALLEFRAGKTPSKIKRVLTDGSVEIWKLSELQVLYKIDYSSF